MPALGPRQHGPARRRLDGARGAPGDGSVGPARPELSVPTPHGVHVRPLLAARTGATFVVASKASAAKSRHLNADVRCSLVIDLSRAQVVVEGHRRAADSKASPPDEVRGHHQHGSAPEEQRCTAGGHQQVPDFMHPSPASSRAGLLAGGGASASLALHADVPGVGLHVAPPAAAASRPRPHVDVADLAGQPAGPAEVAVEPEPDSAQRSVLS